MAKMVKSLNKIGQLQQILKDNAPPLVLFCIETVQKAGHCLLKYNYSTVVERGEGVGAAAFCVKTVRL